MATLTTQNFTATRLTAHSSKTFDQVTDKLYSSIGSPSRTGEWQKAAKNITSYSEASRKQFEDEINAIVGPHGFMIFQEFNHGAWVPLFNVGKGLKSKRIILGNPLIAITMLKYDSMPGLAVPVEIIVREVEKEGKGKVEVEVVWNLPSALIVGENINGTEGLREAAEVLDGKLETLITWCCE